MKAATGELNLTVITIIAIGAVLAFFWIFWPMIQNQINQSWTNATTDKTQIPMIVVGERNYFE